MLPTNKIYIDTKFRTADSISNSDFKIQLSQSLTFPENTAFYITDIAIPHSFQTVESFNNKLHFRVIGESLSANDHIITLTSQLYTGTRLATKISAKLTALNYSPTVVYNASKHQISISITAYSFKLLTDNELKNGVWTGAATNTNNLESANGIIKHTGNVSSVYNNATPYVS